MAAKLMEILEGLRERGLIAYIYGDTVTGWSIRVLTKVTGTGCWYEYPVEPGIVNPYRTVEYVVREIVEEVKRYGKS